MITCAQRRKLRERTIRSLNRSDWPDPRVHIQFDKGGSKTPQERQAHSARLALRHLLATTRADYILFLEDDLEFNRYLHSNLLDWPPLTEGRLTLAGLYNPGLKVLACDVPRRSRNVQ